MALNDAQLLSDTLDILDGTVPLPTVTDAGNAWGTALDAYGAAGEIVNPGPIPAVVPGAAVTALKAALTAGFSTLPGVPATVAAAITAALDVYWAAVTFAGQTPPTAPTGSAALTTALTGIFVVVGGTHAGKAASIRDAVAAYTKLVSAVFPGPAPPSGTFFVT